MTTIIFRHIFKHVFFSIFLLTAVLVFGAWLTQSLRFISIIIEKDISVLHYFSMIYLLFPSLTATVLPICVLLAGVYTLNKLIADNELVILKSCGQSNWQIAAPILSCSVMAAVVCGFLNQYLAPLSTEEFNARRHEISQNFSANLIREGVFNKFKNTMIFVSEYGQNDMYKGVYIEEEGKKDKEEEEEGKKDDSLEETSPMDSSNGNYILFAKTGYLSIADKKNILYLYDGCRQEISNKQSTPQMDPQDTPSDISTGSAAPDNRDRGKQNIAYFDELVYDLDIRQKEKNRSKLHNKISFWEMINPAQTLQKGTRTKLIVEANRRIITSLLILVYALITCSIMLTGQTQRQKRWIKPVLIVGLCLIMHIFILSLLNAYGKNHYAILLCYSILGLFIIASLLIILKPALLTRRTSNSVASVPPTQEEKSHV